jgi:hypothetical protein
VGVDRGRPRRDLLVYAAFVVVLLVAGRRIDARALAGFMPDCAVERLAG